MPSILLQVSEEVNIAGEPLSYYGSCRSLGAVAVLSSMYPIKKFMYSPGLLISRMSATARLYTPNSITNERILEHNSYTR